MKAWNPTPRLDGRGDLPPLRRADATAGAVPRDGREEEVDAAALVPGDLIAVRAGERVPADGFIQAGTSEVNESSITGEPLPREKTHGDQLFRFVERQRLSQDPREPRWRRHDAGARGAPG